ncbi:MAG: S8 family serine peptidase [Planctomycetaceae bacterium]
MGLWSWLRRPQRRSRSDSRVHIRVAAIVEALETRLALSATSDDHEVAEKSMTVEDASTSLLVDLQSYAASRVLVQFRDTTSTVEIDRLLSRYAEHVTQLTALQIYSVDLREGVSVEQALSGFRSSQAVLNAELDYQLRLDAVPVPNDSFWNDLWALNNTGQNAGTFDADIDAYEAWSTTTGNQNLIVAVIDTGIDYLHPDLAANIWTNADEIDGNGIDDDANGYIDDRHGYDFANNDANPMDDNGHGTHVAGTIGAVGNNARGVIGVAPKVQLMALKFLTATGTGFVSNAVRAIDYAVANGAKISNNSWSGGGFSTSLFQAITRAKEAGHLFVAAAGNEGMNAETSPAYPAAYNLDNVLSVAATDRNDLVASFSNYGISSVDLGAPGVSIVSTYRNAQYAIGSGTSMAAPHVSGAAALVWSIHPEWNYEQVIEQISGTVDPLLSLSNLTSTGGRLNAANAVGSAVFATDDYGGDRSTAPTLTIDSQVGGRIETSGDQDWFRLDVNSGDAIEFSLRGITLDDVQFRLYGATNASLIHDYAISAGTLGKWTWTADRTGPVYVAIASSDNLGMYRLAASHVNVPPILQDRVFTLAENSPVGTVIGTLTGFDPNDTLHYTIVAGNEAGIFSLDPATGTLKVQSSTPLDFESQSSLVLNVSVSDAAGLKDTATVTIRLSDVNEAPRLDDLTYRMMGNTANGTRLLQLQASDPEPGQRRTYSLVAQISSSAIVSHFSIDTATGWLKLDSSAAALIASQSAIELTVRVTDEFGLWDTATVRILPAVYWEEQILHVQGNNVAEDFLIRSLEGDLLVTRSGITDRIDLNGQPAIVFLDGAGGADKLTIVGTAANETALLRGQTVDWSGPQVRLLGSDLEEITLKSGGGLDRAELFDSAGNDNYVGAPTSAVFAGSDFKHQLQNFYRVAVTSESGSDRARFFDSAGDETFVGRADYAVLTGSSFYQSVAGFERVQTYMTEGGFDRAKLFDSTGQDVLTMAPDYVQMTGAGYSYYLRGMDRVDAWSTLGGNDRVQFFDSAERDTFVSTATYAGLVNSQYAHYASGFSLVEAFSQAGGLDRAKLYDSAGNDTFTASSLLNTARWQGTSFDIRTSGFQLINVYATAGGYDRILIDGLQDPDVAIGRASYATLTTPLASMRFDGLDYLSLTSSDGTHPLYDITDIDYAFEKFGTWVTRATRASRAA